VNLLWLLDRKWKIGVERTQDGSCELLDELVRLLKDNYKPNVAGLVKVLEMLADEGPRRLKESVIHEADKAEKIWEITKGSLRIYFFHGDREIIICSHVIVKKHQKTKKRDVERSARLRKKYESALIDGTLKIERDHNAIQQLC
jgi:phage-related protein